MTRLLKRAFENVSKLPDIEQNALAKWLLEELESERRWDEMFSENEDALDLLADEAIEAHEKGETTTLDIGKL